MSGSLGERFREIEQENNWMKLFNKIRFDSSKHYSKLATKAAKSSHNFRLNRYRDVLPYDHSRVVLPSGSYINASHVYVSEANREYILTQGPLPDTAEHFWEMVWHQNSKAIIMLNKIIEKNQIKCHQYFPVTADSDDDVNCGGEELTFGDFVVSLVHENKTSDHFCVRTFSLINNKLQQTREVWHFQFNTWPDFGVPQSTNEFLEFLYEVRKRKALCRNLYGPPVIHCSAGIGRSGTFILVDAVLIIAKNSKNISDIDIVEMVTQMRQYRMGLIQTFDQLKFCWMAIVDALEKEEWKDLLDTAEPGPPAFSVPMPVKNLTVIDSLATGDFSSSPNRPDFYRSSANSPTDEDSDESPEREQTPPAVMDDRGDDHVLPCPKRRKSEQQQTPSLAADDESCGGGGKGCDDNNATKTSVANGDLASQSSTSAAPFHKKSPSIQDSETLQSYLIRLQQRQEKAQALRDRIDHIHTKLRRSDRLNSYLFYRVWSRSKIFAQRHSFYVLGGCGLLLGVVGYYYFSYWNSR